jgi:hypothetical protein
VNIRRFIHVFKPVFDDFSKILKSDWQFLPHSC